MEILDSFKNDKQYFIVVINVSKSCILDEYGIANRYNFISSSNELDKLLEELEQVILKRGYKKLKEEKTPKSKCILYSIMSKSEDTISNTLEYGIEIEIQQVGAQPCDIINEILNDEHFLK